MKRPRLLLIGLILAAGLFPPPALAQVPGTPAAVGDSVGAGPDAFVLPGDQITLKIWKEPEMSGTYSVSEEGMVTLPKLGAVEVAGQRIGAVQEQLRSRYSEYLRNPAIEIIVLRRIGVQGEVRRPDLYLVDLTMTLREVIAKAGGITETGDPDKVRIVREGKRIPLEEGEMSRFLARELRSGDQVVVGQRSWFERNSLAIVSTATVVAGLMIPLMRDLFSNQSSHSAPGPQWP